MEENNNTNINTNINTNKEINTKLCKFYINGSCTSQTCTFLHKDNICKYYYLNGECKHKTECKFSHEFRLLKKKKKYPKNTQNFTPSHKPSHMNIVVGDSTKNNYGKAVKTNDVILVNNFLNQDQKYLYYNKLLQEINESGLDEKSLWKLWHGDTHSIIDDHINWKEKIPTFQNIIQKIESYFGFATTSSRFNFYKNSNDWKPFHHDAAAIKPHIAKKQNMTIAISFGLKRDVAFEFNDNKCIVSMPLEDNSIYAFACDVNINWKHGIPQMHPHDFTEDGRISIILWGWCDQFTA